MNKRLILIVLAWLPLLGWCALNDVFTADIQYIDNAGSTQTVGMYFKVTSSTSPYQVEVAARTNEGALATKVNGKTLIIPSTVSRTIDGNTYTYSVTGLEKEAFLYSASVFDQIQLPKTLTAIGTNALSSISVSAFTVEEGNDHFSVDEDGVLYNQNNTELVRYPNNKTTTDYAIRSSVTAIGPYAFSSCKKLKTVTMGDQVTSLGEYVFNGCDFLTQVTLSQGLTSIPEYAFFDCSSLEGIEIPKAVTDLGQDAFRQCSKLTSVHIPKGVKRIESETFRLCKSLSVVTFPSSLNYIGSFAFYGDSKLTYIDIPDGTNIDYGAFMNCSGLTTVVLMPGVTISEPKREDGNQFSHCTHLSKVFSLKTSGYQIGKETFSYCGNDLKVFVPLGAELSYQNNNWPSDIRPIVNLNKATGKTFAYESNINLDSTLVVDANYEDITSGNDLKAYQATTVTDPGTGNMKVTGKLTSGIVPAKTGLILYGSQDRLYLLKPTTSPATADVSNNKLVGVLDDVSMNNKTGSRYFIYNGGTFYVSKGSYFTTSAPSSSVSSFPGSYTYASKYAYKCYLDCGQAVPAKALSFYLDDTPTGIVSVDSNKTDQDGYYNLYGMKVDHPTQKGIYIHHGKKVFIK